MMELGIRIAKYDDVAEEVIGWCPAHYERTGKTDRKPSWSVNTESGVFNCFSCGWKGQFVHLVAYMLGTSADESAAWVRKRGSIERAKRKRGLLETVGGRELEEVRPSDLALFTRVPEEMCDSRDLDPDCVDHYGVLWDPKEELWVTPIYDPYEKTLIGWQEKNKKIFRNQPPGLKKSSTLFGLPQFTGGTMILVESPLDCTKILGAGITGACSSMGVAVSDTQLSLACSLSDQIVMALDNDRDGWNMAAQMRERVRGRVPLYFWNYEDFDAKDPGEQSDGQIVHSYETAISALRARHLFR